MLFSRQLFRIHALLLSKIIFPNQNTVVNICNYCNNISRRKEPMHHFDFESYILSGNPVCFSFIKREVWFFIIFEKGGVFRFLKKEECSEKINSDFFHKKGWFHKIGGYFKKGFTRRTASNLIAYHLINRYDFCKWIIFEKKKHCGK